MERTCVICNNPLPPEADGRWKYCKECKKIAKKEKQLRAYNKKKNKRLCCCCGKPVENNMAYCEDCAARRDGFTQELRDLRVADNLCILCGQNPIYRWKYCQECYEVQKEKNRSRHWERRIAGVCSVCQKPAKILPDGNVSTYCEEHYKKYYNAAKDRYYARKAAGLCVSCGKPAYDPGEKPRVHCPECAQKAVDCQSRRRAGLPPSKPKRIR